MNVVHSMLGDFGASAQGISSRLRVAFERRDFESIRMLAHTLQSSARSVGALPLGDLCQTMEASAANHPEQLEPLLGEFAAEIARVAAALHTLLPKAAAQETAA
ncbi:MAG: Hpt domain-containing protein [Gemmatimonadaceae bacterium]